jgi:hypothetical protein
LAFAQVVHEQVAHGPTGDRVPVDQLLDRALPEAQHIADHDVAEQAALAAMINYLRPFRAPQRSVYEPQTVYVAGMGRRVSVRAAPGSRRAGSDMARACPMNHIVDHRARPI